MLFCRSPYVGGYLRLPMSLNGGVVTLRALVGYGVRPKCQIKNNSQKAIEDIG